VNVVCEAVAVNSVNVLYADVVTPDAGMPRYLTEMLAVPLGGAVENVNVVPTTEYVVGFCVTPVITTNIELEVAGATDIVNAVVEPLPLKLSVKKATEFKGFPIRAII